MEKITKNIVLIDTYNREESVYFDEFKDEMELESLFVEGENENMKAFNSNGECIDTFNAWYLRHCDIIDDDFWYGFKNAMKNRNLDCVVTGQLSLFDGKHNIVPTCGNFMEMVKKCLEDAYDYVIKIEDGVMKIENHHHDGTNYYEIRLVNGENYNKIVYWDDEEDGDLVQFLNNKDNFEDFYYEYFYVVY